MPEKKEELEDRAEAGEDDPLLRLYHQDHGEGNTRVEAHSNGSEAVADPQAGRHGAKVTNVHDVHSMEHDGEAHQQHHDMSGDRPMFATVTIATCHCGAGCVLGDIIGEWLIYRSGATIGGSMLYAAFVVGESVPIAVLICQFLARSADTLAFS